VGRGPGRARRPVAAGAAGIVGRLTAAPAPKRTLDFLVIGAQKSGTTTLWRGLDSHPQIATPGDKERGFFNSDERYERGLAAYVADAFARTGADQRIGTVTPGYRPALAEKLDVIIERMRRTTPDVRLIALLRDPLRRAVSHYRTGLRTGHAKLRPFDDHYEAVCRQLDVPWPPLVLRGEYGRILSRYLDAFAREQLLVLWTDDLERDPAGVHRRVYAFLEVDPAHEVPEVGRLNVGGTRRRVSSTAMDELKAHLEREVWPRVAGERRGELLRATHWWLEHLWNTVPDDEATDVGEALRRRLVERFAADGALLRERLGEEPPWLAAYEAQLAAA
jgi:hypothetical protein